MVGARPAQPGVFGLKKETLFLSRRTVETPSPVVESTGHLSLGEVNKILPSKATPSKFSGSPADGPSVVYLGGGSQPAKNHILPSEIQPHPEGARPKNSNLPSNVKGKLICTLMLLLCGIDSGSSASRIGEANQRDLNADSLEVFDARKDVKNSGFLVTQAGEFYEVGSILAAAKLSAQLHPRDDCPPHRPSLLLLGYPQNHDVVNPEYVRGYGTSCPRFIPSQSRPHLRSLCAVFLFLSYLRNMDLAFPIGTAVIHIHFYHSKILIDINGFHRRENLTFIKLFSSFYPTALFCCKKMSVHPARRNHLIKFIQLTLKCIYYLKCFLSSQHKKIPTEIREFGQRKKNHRHEEPATSTLNRQKLIEIVIIHPAFLSQMRKSQQQHIKVNGRTIGGLGPRPKFQNKPTFDHCHEEQNSLQHHKHHSRDAFSSQKKIVHSELNGTACATHCANRTGIGKKLMLRGGFEPPQTARTSQHVQFGKIKESEFRFQKAGELTAGAAKEDNCEITHTYIHPFSASFSLFFFKKKIYVWPIIRG
ncbi:hypothetical protein VP01_227g3 [Puccinia sorghi]|uniref:Uncharacterized protein n=1 Tax=Puccinia sorghi TaxID=27349 RepID=A0A0L6V817_9BASI|nr:hypothetical protein VP01_227g3 [Puccinia sorghi]